MPTNCHHCHGVNSMEEGTTQFCACEAPEPFIVENVPARVCDNCTESIFSGSVVEKFEQIRQGGFEPNGYRTIRVYDFSGLKPGKK